MPAFVNYLSKTAGVRKCTERFTDAKQPEIVLGKGALKSTCGTQIGGKSDAAFGRTDSQGWRHQAR